MPMGCLNAHATFCCLVDTMKRDWNKTATEQGIRDDIEVTLKGQRPWTDAEVIVDDVMLHSVNPQSLIQYFEIALQTLQHYRVTVKLKKCRFFPQSAEFVGMDVEADGNRPARSKMQALLDLKETTPNTLADLRKLIGLLGFYQDWIPNYELRISPWRKHVKTLKDAEAAGQTTQLSEIWTPADNTNMCELLEELMTRPVLARPDYTRRFYLKTDWCRLGMAAVLLQADPDDKAATEAEQQETGGGPCKFDKANHKLRLRPIAFSSRRCNEQEGNQHSFTGEAATGVWAIEKYHRHLFGREFTWMTDCNGLRQFFEGTDVPTHAHQRMRQRLLRFMFTIVHRPAKFMVECDALTRYNRATEEWRTTNNTSTTNPSNTTAVNMWATTQIPSTAMAFANQPINIVGQQGRPQTPLARQCNTSKTIWVTNAGATTTIQALHAAGIDPRDAIRIEDDNQLRNSTHETRMTHDQEVITSEQALYDDDRSKHDDFECEQIDWLITHDAGDNDTMQHTQTNDTMRRLIRAASRKNVRWIIIFTRHDSSLEEHPTQPTTTLLGTPGFHTLKTRVHAHRYGAAMEGEFIMIVATRTRAALETFNLQHEPATGLAEHMDIDTSFGNTTDNETTIHDVKRTHATHNKENQARVAAMVQRKSGDTHDKEWQTAWIPAYDIDHPGPDLKRTENQWHESPFAVEIDNPEPTTHTIRGIRIHELTRAMGFDETSASHLVHMEPETALERIRATPPMQLIRATITGIMEADQHIQTHDDSLTDAGIHDIPESEVTTYTEALRSMLAAEMQQTTKIPLPTTANWQDSTRDDSDTAMIIEALNTGTVPDRTEFVETGYYTELINNRLEHEDGILYRHETNNRRAIRHLRARVVPKRLRQAIFSALHTSPMAGHTGYHKTFWKIAARYYWPGMTQAIREMTLGCAHCKAANIASHDAQQELKTFEADAPFDVITMDIWHPGRAASLRNKESHVLICLDTMTGFASATFVPALDSDTITTAAFTSFFTTHGLPKLTIIDAGNEFAGTLQTMCTGIGLPFYTVSRGNHKAILCERFNRYLNKVQRIHAADCETYQDFAIGTIFAVYAWNAAPVDGTNIIRSYAAIGREFPFPIDIEREPIIPRENQNTGEQTLNHIEATFPLFQKQRELLRYLNDDRCAHHRDLKTKEEK